MESFKPYSKMTVQLASGAFRRAQKFGNGTVRVNIQRDGKLVGVSGTVVDGVFRPKDKKYDSYFDGYQRQRLPVEASTKEEYWGVVKGRRHEKFKDFDLTVDTPFGPRKVNNYNNVTQKRKYVRVTPDFKAKKFVMAVDS